jgi:hypothetical protein
MRISPPISIAWGALALALVLASMARADDAADQLAARRARAWVKVPMDRAIAAARESFPDAVVYRAALRLDGDTPTYEIRLVVPGAVKVVRVDAATGKILDTSDAPRRAVYWPFDEEKSGAPPTAWSIRQTDPTRALATWEIVDDASSPTPFRAFALTRSENTGNTFNLAILERAEFRDLQLDVHVKAVRGREDQGGGPIWRCRDENNYYVCRFNPLEGNYRVYVVKEGRRTELRSATVHTVPDRWYEVSVRMIGNRIVCRLDGRELLEVEDDTFGEPGRVGLWTKADAVTSFDALAVRELEAGDAAGGDEASRGRRSDR